MRLVRIAGPTEAMRALGEVERHDADGEGGFQPLPAICPKIEREVHPALLALLSEAAV